MESPIFDSLMNFSNTEQKEKPVEEKKLKPSERFLLELEKKGFNLSQMKGILQTNGVQLVVSCAGSGKTTTLVFKILYDLRTGYATKVIDVNGNHLRVPDSILVSTFLSSGAEELKLSISKWIRDLHLTDSSSAIQFSTLHAEFLRALKQYGFSKPLVKDATNSAYLKEVVKGYHLVNGRGNPLNSEDYNNLESALNYTRNRLDGKRYDKEIYDELNIGVSIIDAILRDWKAKRAANGVVDFDDLQELIWEECYIKKNQDFIDFLSKRYNFIYIDEFQDTSQVQYEVLKIYALNSKQLFVIGDDDQTIYSWRGSDHKVITETFPNDFSPVINKLAINYRCPKNVLDAIVPSIVLNEERYDKPLQSSKEGGHVRVLEGANYTDMVENLADLVYNDLKNKRSVAILCRVNTDGLLPALMFDRLDKFSFSISGKNMTLDSYIGTTVLSIIKLFTERSTPAVKRALELLAWDTYGISALIKVCKTNKTSIWEIDEKDLSYSCPSIAERIIRWRSRLASSNEVETLKFVLADYRTNIFQKDSQFNNVMRSTLMSVETMLSYVNYSDVESFLYDLENTNERLNGRIKNTRCEVKIATVHEFKGKEADSVYIWNDSVDVFPIKDSIEGTPDYEEERRIHYIACTRSRDYSTIVYLRGKEGAFVKEMDLSNADTLTGTKVLQGILVKHSEESKNLQAFSEEMERRESQSAIAEEYNSALRPANQYSDNGFWGSDGD